MANNIPQTETENSIKLCLTEMQKLKGELKEVKKSIRNEKKNDDQDYKDLKKQIKGLNKQTQQMQMDFENGLKDDADYNALIKLKCSLEENFAKRYGDLQSFVAQLPQAAIQLSIETELGKMMVNLNPEMKVYVNGKEEKRNV